MTAGRSDLVEIDAELVWETPGAFGVDSGERDRRGQKILVWLPKSLTEDNGDGSYTLPEWLALEKGLI